MSSDTGRLRIFPAILQKAAGVEWTRGLLLTCLLGLSWWSTTQGLVGLVSAANGAPGITALITIGFAVGILTLLISWTLDRLYRGEAGLLAPLFLAGYILLTVISVGFGYGFYWQHIESHSAAQRTAEDEAERLSRRFTLAYARLDESVSALGTVADISIERAEREEQTGGTCGAGSLAGPGPRYRLRKSDAASMTAIRNRIVGQIGKPGDPAGGTLLALQQQLYAQLDNLSADVFVTLNESQLKELLNDTETLLVDTASRYEAFRTGPSVTNAITLLKHRIEQGKGIMMDGEVRFTCPDTELDIIMSQAVESLVKLPEIPEIKLHVPLGPEATVAAFGKFGNTMLVPFRGKTEAKLMSGRDYIPLGVAVAIDLFILILSLHGKPVRSFTGHVEMDEMLDHPGFVHHLVGGADSLDDPTHHELLKFSFWWRGAYYLATPIYSGVDEVRQRVHQKLSMAAMILADAGLLVPLSAGYRDGKWIENLGGQHDHHTRAAVASDYNLYRYKRNSLSRMTTLLAGHSGIGRAQYISKELKNKRQSTQSADARGRPATLQRVAGLMSKAGASAKRRGFPRRLK